MENEGFSAMLEARMQAVTAADRAKIDAEIYQRYERDAAVMIIDMSGFSRITQEEGIVHFLELIQRMHGLVLPIIRAANGGHVVKTEADNVYARFTTVQAAVETAIKLQQTCQQAFASQRDNDAVKLSIGIAWGRILDLDGREYYGDPVNLASKLGEDLASAGDIFITKEAATASRLPEGWTGEPRSDRISNIDLDFVSLVRG